MVHWRGEVPSTIGHHSVRRKRTYDQRISYAYDDDKRMSSAYANEWGLPTYSELPAYVYYLVPPA